MDNSTKKRIFFLILSSVFFVLLYFSVAYSVIYLLGFRNFDEIQCYSAFDCFVLHSFSVISIAAIFVYLIRKQNLWISIAIIFLVLFSFGFWIFTPMHFLEFLAGLFHSENIYGFANLIRGIFFILLVILLVVYLINIKKKKLNLFRKKVILTYMVFLLISCIIQIMGTLSIVFFYGSSFSESISIILDGRIGGIYWGVMLFRQDILIYLSLGYIIYDLYGKSKLINPIHVNGSKKHFLLIWLFLGMFGFERFVSEDKYNITFFQTTTSIILLIVYFLSLKYFTSFELNPPLFIALLFIVPVLKISVWISSFFLKVF